MNDRTYWLDVLRRIAMPVLGALAKGQLRKTMPVRAAEGHAANRALVTHLEALGRTLVGIAPWLELQHIDDPAESALQTELRQLARAAIDSGTDPDSPDFLNFHDNAQAVVDSAFLSHALLRAPHELWQKLSERTKGNLQKCLRATRVIRPAFNNWLLFSAMVETALAMSGSEWDQMRVDYSIRQHEQWYKGDGVYGDGPQLHFDYYNSYVIQPMLIDVLETVGHHADAWKELKPKVIQRAQRYAQIQELLIAPDGSFPPTGRSICYRGGAFQTLAQIALREQLPKPVTPAQVRCGLTAMLRRTMEAPETFDDKGWLQIGLAGHQPGLGERYISTGSLYLCSACLLPLGLPATSPFWSDAAADWSSKKIWNGQDALADHAL